MHAIVQSFIHFFYSFPPVLATILMAIFPIAERVALPTAIAVFHLPAWEAFILVFLGNMVPVTLILVLADRFHAWLSKHNSIFGRTWVKTIAHAQAKFAKYEKYGLIGLFIFLILPTPLNGAFTASIIAFILGYKFKHSFPVLFAGVLIYNSLVLAATLGVGWVF